jgi:hypothetical protein
MTLDVGAVTDRAYISKGILLHLLHSFEDNRLRAVAVHCDALGRSIFDHFTGQCRSAFAISRGREANFKNRKRKIRGSCSTGRLPPLIAPSAEASVCCENDTFAAFGVVVR